MVKFFCQDGQWLVSPIYNLRFNPLKFETSNFLNAKHSFGIYNLQLITATHVCLYLCLCTCAMVLYMCCWQPYVRLGDDTYHNHL